MPKNVFENSSSSNNNGNNIDTSLFLQKRYLRTNYIESDIEEDNDLKKNNIKVKIYLIQLRYTIVVIKIMLIIYSTILE